MDSATSRIESVMKSATKVILEPIILPLACVNLNTLADAENCVEWKL